MPGKSKNYVNLTDIVSAFIQQYYLIIEQDRDIRRDPERHMKLINKLNAKYIKDLRKQHFHTEEGEGLFSYRIEYLTQAKKKYEDLQKRKAPVSI